MASFTHKNLVERLLSQQVSPGVHRGVDWMSMSHKLCSSCSFVIVSMMVFDYQNIVGNYHHVQLIDAFNADS
jgi:hypothetical protein